MGRQIMQEIVLPEFSCVIEKSSHKLSLQLTFPMAASRHMARMYT